MMGRTLGGGVRTELEANLNAADQYCQTSSNCFSNNAPTSRNLQVITGRSAREAARERVCFAQKPIAATKKMALWATQQPQRGGTTSCASRPCAGIDRAKCLISLNATGEQAANCSPVALAVGLVAPVRPARPAGRHARGVKSIEIKCLAQRGGGEEVA